jgi:hypothetical protein
MERQRNAAARASWISARFIEPYNPAGSGKRRSTYAAS